MLHTLTVTLSPFDAAALVREPFKNAAGPTTVVFRGSGGGESALFRFGWGAGTDFAATVAAALGPHLADAAADRP